MINVVYQIAIAGIVRFFILICNCICFIFENLMRGKVKLDVAKQIVVITGCDSGFGEMYYFRD